MAYDEQTPYSDAFVDRNLFIIFNQISLKFVPEPTLTHLSNVYMRHHASNDRFNGPL